MSEPIIHGLFPTPVLSTKINRDFTKKEIDFVLKQKNNSIKNVGNFISKDEFILKNKQLKNIRKFLENQCKFYLNNVLGISDKIELYITLSWLNFTDGKQFHHMHQHTNSLISGVLYLKADKENDTITFAKKQYREITIPTENFNTWNSGSWWLPIETGQLLMFPSFLLHEVQTKKDNNLRISLAFNTFISGTLGGSTTKLKLTKDKIYKCT
tara:strand:+ start:610 stop:1245 length:636 start_codon:yes stop_codon:yes gene_type:complete